MVRAEAVQVHTHMAKIGGESPGREVLQKADKHVWTNRCRYVNRPSGCKNGWDCNFCHVHALPKTETRGNTDGTAHKQLEQKAR